MGKNKNTLVSVTITEEMTMENLVRLVSFAVSEEDAPKFIALLDLAYADWSVTEEIIKHFLYVKKEEDTDPMFPIKLNPKSALPVKKKNP